MRVKHEGFRLPCRADLLFLGGGEPNSSFTGPTDKKPLSSPPTMHVVNWEAFYHVNGHKFVEYWHCDAQAELDS